MTVTHVFGSSIGPFTRRLLEWVHEEGFCDEATRDKDWIEYANLLGSGVEPLEEFERVKDAIAALTGSKTKAELLAQSLARKLLVAPVLTVPEVLDLDQLEDRGYWQQVGPTGSRAASSRRRPRRWPCSAPRPTWGRTPRPWWPRAGRRAAGRVRVAVDRRADRARPLEGLKVLDLTWAVAGPTVTRALADFGATVVRIESPTTRPESAGRQPFHRRRGGLEGSPQFHNINAGKLGL